jgi:hypothetical protein
MSTEKKAMATRKTKITPKVKENGTATPVKPEPNLFNLTFKNTAGVSVVSVPEEQIHHMAQAIHHFFRERNIESTFNFKPNEGQSTTPPEGS